MPTYPVETLVPKKDGAKAETAESIDNKTIAAFIVISLIFKGYGNREIAIATEAGEADQFL